MFIFVMIIYVQAWRVAIAETNILLIIMIIMMIYCLISRSARIFLLSCHYDMIMCMCIECMLTFSITYLSAKYVDKYPLLVFLKSYAQHDYYVRFLFQEDY
jgi:hypothetical protein